MSVAKIIELVGSSDKSWDDAAKVAVSRAGKTMRNLRGVEIVKMTAIVKNNQITEYRATVKVSFAVEE